MTEHTMAERLQAPFALEDHYLKQGMVYIREYAITGRLSEVDPGWTNRIVSQGLNHDGTQYVIYMELTVCGITRVNAGMDSLKTGSKETEKATVTDALKRAARLFGVGAYIQTAGKMESENQLASWVRSLTEPPWVLDAERIKKFYQWCNDKYNLDQEDALKVLQVFKIEDYEGTNREAATAIQVHANQHQEEAAPHWTSFTPSRENFFIKAAEITGNDDDQNTLDLLGVEAPAQIPHATMEDALQAIQQIHDNLNKQGA